MVVVSNIKCDNDRANFHILNWNYKTETWEGIIGEKIGWVAVDVGPKGWPSTVGHQYDIHFY